MPDIPIQWVKIITGMFDDAKIKLIRKLPEGDAILNMWIQLICMAGTCNQDGGISLSDTLFYTDEMLATVMGRDLPVVRLALATLCDLKMIEWQNGRRLYLPNFAKHQNIDGLERVKMLNAKRNRELRARRKQLQLTLPNNTSDVSVTSRDASPFPPYPLTPLDRDIERDIDIDIDNELSLNNIIKLWGRTKELLKKEVSEPNYRTWIEKTTGLLWEDGYFIVGCDAQHQVEYLENNQRGLIEKILCQVTGKDTKVQFILKEAAG